MTLFPASTTLKALVVFVKHARSATWSRCNEHGLMQLPVMDFAFSAELVAIEAVWAFSSKHTAAATTRSNHAIDLHAASLAFFNLHRQVEFAEFGLAPVNPLPTLLAVLLFRVAEIQVSRNADFEHSVVRVCKFQGKFAAISILGWHNVRVEDGDQRANR